jgi:transcriptional regulator with XRE-family HTH domain
MVMKPTDFKRWRKDLGLSQKDAADLLGLKRRMIQYYEKGRRDGQKVAVPKTVRLACYALAAGVSDYNGPSRPKRKPKAPAPKP